MLGNIAKGYKAARTLGKASREASRYADDAFNAAAANIGNAKDAAKFYGSRKAYMDDFMSEYMKGAPAAQYDTIGEQIGRVGAGAASQAGNAGRFIMENPAGQMALFAAPMLIPMGGGQPSAPSPEQIQMMREQQAMQQQAMIQRQMMEAAAYGGYPQGY